MISNYIILLVHDMTGVFNLNGNERKALQHVAAVLHNHVRDINDTEGEARLRPQVSSPSFSKRRFHVIHRRRALRPLQIGDLVAATIALLLVSGSHGLRVFSGANRKAAARFA